MSVNNLNRVSLNTGLLARFLSQKMGILLMDTTVLVFIGNYMV